MNRRNLIKVSSLFAVSSIFSASISAITSRRVNAQSCRSVDTSSSSCAKAIQGVFNYYKLRLNSFNIKYSDRSGNCYVYASSGSTKAVKKIEEQTDAILSPTSLNKSPSFDDFRNTIAQGASLPEQVYNAIWNAMTKEGVLLSFAQLSATGPNGEPCTLNAYGPPGMSTYGPAPQP